MSLFWYFAGLFPVLVVVIISVLCTHWRLLFVHLVEVIAFGFILRTWIAPSVLRRISGKIRVRSISPRSIRGFQFRAGKYAFHVDRIGLSYHGPSAKTARRFSIKVENLRIELHEHRGGAREALLRQKSGDETLKDLESSFVERVLWRFFSAIYAFLGPYVRPVVRTFFVAILRLIIRSLPALTQVLDLETDKIMIVSAAFSGAYMLFEDITLYTEATFAELENVIDSDLQKPSLNPRQRRLLDMAHWKVRFISSAGRVWNRAWGNTRGSASIMLKIGDVFCCAGPKGVGLKQGSSNLNMDEHYNRTESGSPLASCKSLSVSGLSEFSTAFSFSPRTGLVDSHSITMGISLPRLDFSLDDVITLAQIFRGQGDPAPSNRGSSSRSRLTQGSISSKYESNHRSASTSNKIFGVGSSGFLSKVKSFEILSPGIVFHYRLSADTEIVSEIGSVSMSGGLSHPESNTLHRQHLGLNLTGAENGEEVHAITFSIASVRIDMLNVLLDQPKTRVLVIDSSELQLIISRRRPGVTVQSFWSESDPGSCLLIMQASIYGVKLMLSSQNIVQLLAAKFGRNTVDEPKKKYSRIFIPSFIISCEIKGIDCVLAFLDNGRTADVLCVHSNSLILQSSSSCYYVSDRQNEYGHVRTSPIKSLLDVKLFVDPMSTSICHLIAEEEIIGLLLNEFVIPKEQKLDVMSSNFAEIDAHGEILGSLAEEEDVVASFETETLIAHAECMMEAMNLEFWQPSVLASVSEIVKHIKKHSSSTSTHTHETQGSSELPFCLSLRFALSSLVIYTAARELNPNDDLELYRGIGLRTGVSFEYSVPFVDQQSNSTVSSRGRLHSRQSLSLQDELTVDVISAAEDGTQSALSWIRVTMWNTSIRSIVATEYELDQECGIDERRPEMKANEFFWVDRVELSIRIRKHTHSNDLKKQEFHIDLKIPYIHTSLKLFHSYCLFLALRALHSLFDTERGSLEKRASTHGLSWTISATFDVIQMLLEYPLRSKMCVRINGLSAQAAKDDCPQIAWESLVVWVFSDFRSERWDEILCLDDGKITYQIMTSNSPTYAVELDRVLIHVPFGFVAADLILDITLLFKCLRHLMRVVSSGKFQPIENPVPEQAKKVSSISFTMKILCIEAADDPLESKLALTWKTGMEFAKTRSERDDAFEVKVATINAAENRGRDDIENEADDTYRFTAAHSVSVDEAHERLLQVHSVSWILRHKEARNAQAKREANIQRHIYHKPNHCIGFEVPLLIDPAASPDTPPLIRLTLVDINLSLRPPTFSSSGLSEFLCDVGDGLPDTTQFTLLIPMYLDVSIGSTSLFLRDYPLPLLNVPGNKSTSDGAWKFRTSVVIAEEAGSDSSVLWRDCAVISEGDLSAVGGNPFVVSVPKTTMPVKLYADSAVHVMTDGITDFSWGVSYNSSLQDVMRVVENITTPPSDLSPPMGFWDKMRLILHCRLIINFKNKVCLNIKGARDPYNIIGDGAGFSFCWDGNTRMTIGYSNADNEFLQVTSDEMFIIIPNFRRFWHASDTAIPTSQSLDPAHGNLKSMDSSTAQKICAKFNGGIRWGIGIVFERTCSLSCSVCHGTKTCRLFTFPAHYTVSLMPKTTVPKEKSQDDSFKDFRSDFIHLSTSLTTSAKNLSAKVPLHFNNFHLTPKAFTHFWAWWSLFNNSLSLPIRQGPLFPQRRPTSKKFGRHLATIKYRLSLANLYISHVYVDESRDSWSKGLTSCVGIKAFIDKFQADMHQREQETTVLTGMPLRTKTIRHKPFYSAEVNISGLDLRAVRGLFEDPIKRLAVSSKFLMESSPFSRANEPKPTELTSPWVNLDDFVEIDWMPSASPSVLHVIPVATCPYFTYHKRYNKQDSTLETSRFGEEDTHRCLMGKGTKTQEAQDMLVKERLNELEKELNEFSTSEDLQASDIELEEHRVTSIRNMISLLEQYLQGSSEETRSSDTDRSDGYWKNEKFYLASDILHPMDWQQFDNIYEMHCPKVFIRNFTRDILVRYYICSRTRRGFEYHMATRAVKFIRDQADTMLSKSHVGEKGKKGWRPVSGAQAAATAIRKILGGDGESKSFPEHTETCQEKMEHLDPLSGWSDGVTLNRSHFVMLLKPQLVLRSDVTESSVCILTALQATLQGFSIMDTSNAEDPISGRVMRRTYALLNGLQAFAPSATHNLDDDFVPLEVLLDLRCESSDYDRLVPQTDATLQYDKFNRLRLRNNVTSLSVSPSDEVNGHLHNQTDLIDIWIPQFKLLADSRQFEAVSNIVTDLLLFSDAAYKTHLNKVETLLFAYDFANLASTATVVSNLQCRLRNVVELERAVAMNSLQNGNLGDADVYNLKGHVFTLAEELNLIFDVIKLAQDRADGIHNDQKSALRLHASSNEISWRMLDDNHELIAKLAVRGISFSWLNRQDSSTVNTVYIRDLQAFDGAPEAEWPEILSKYDEPSNHPMVKRGLFLVADWTVLAPVGGISIYERFVLDFHPMRVQIDGRAGRNVMEYLWPAKRDRGKGGSFDTVESGYSDLDVPIPSGKGLGQRSSLDSPRISRLAVSHTAEDESRSLHPKTLGNSRSFSDLRQMSQAGPSRQAEEMHARATPIPRSDSHLPVKDEAESHDSRTESTSGATAMHWGARRGKNDAVEMRSRSSQKTFILVKISSIHLLLSIRKEQSFFCRDARIQTRELEYRNRTFSFEELADLFIPTDHTWRGWVRVAFQQPLLPVFPVARELISKTKWLGKNKGKSTVGKRPKGVKGGKWGSMSMSMSMSRLRGGSSTGKEEERRSEDS